MVMDTLRDLTLHGSGNPPAFHIPLAQEFSTYVRGLGQFQGGGEAADDEDARDEVEEENQMFRDL